MRTYHLQSFSGTLVTLTAACLTCSLLLLGFAGSLRAEVIVDDDFSSGLGAWNTEGLVGLERDTPILADGAVVPALWTGGEVTGYMHEIRFEVFLGGLSPDAGTGTVDKFQITVHVGDDPSTVGPSSNTSSKVVLEVTGDGTLSGLSTALIVPDIAKGDGWYSGIVEVAISETAAAISFSIANNNGLSDSTITLDYVRVSLIARGRLSNISNRGDALTGGGILITGFVLRGTEGKSLLVRAMGPRLESPFGVLGYLSDPILDLIPGGASQSIAQNDDWQVSSNAAEIAQAITALGAYPFDEGSKDSAMLVKDLEPIAQGYTVWVSGVGNTTGVSLAEVYAADSGVDGPTELVNISSRGPIGDGNHRPILGWVLSGDRGRKIMARAMGPTLNASPQDGGFGLSGFVDDPVLEIYQYVSETQSNDLIYTNDDWGLADNAIEVPVVGAAVGAFTPVTGSKDAVVLASLSPGIYTAVAKTKNGEHGLALVELYVVTDNRRPVATNNLIFVSAGVQSIIPVEPFIANYVDPDNDTLVIVSYGQPTHGTLTRNEAGDFVFAPPTGYIGETLFSYTVSDGEYESLPATVALQVAPPNTAIWVGGAEGNFSDADNWQDGEVPGPDDTVWLADIDQDFTVNLDVDATINALRVGGAGANVVFKMTTGRSLTVAETIDVQPGSIFDWSAGNLTTTGDFSIAGNLHWSGGSMNGSGETIIEAGATALIDGPVDLRHQRKFTNKGAVVQSGSNSMRAYGDDAIVAVTNAAGGTWTEQSREGATMLYAYNGYGQASFVNAGKLVVASSCTIGGGGGKTVLTNDAELQIDAGQVFTLGSGTHGFAGGSSSKGSGQLKLSGATLNITGAATATDLLLENGTLRVQDAPLTVTAFSQTGGTLDGAEVLTVTGTFNWSGGSHNETGELVVGVEATALINGGVDLRHQRKFTNKGTVVQSGNNSMRAYGDDANVVVVTNADGATWTAESREGASILYSYNGYGKSSFVNAGTLVSQSSTSIGGGGGSTTLNNSGVFKIESGIFTCNADTGVHSGDWVVDSGTSFIFNSGTHSLDAGVSGEGGVVIAGTASVSVLAEVTFAALQLGAGTLSVDSPEGLLRVGTMNQSGGALTGVNTLIVTDSLVWSGGTQQGTGTTEVAATATALIDGPVDLRHQRKFTNKGAVVQSGSNSMRAYGDDAIVAVTNAAGGTWTEQSREGATMLYAYNGYGQASFVNAGKLVVASSCTIGGGGGKTTFSNNGLVDVTAGGFDCNADSGTHGGDWKVASGTSFTFNRGGHVIGEGASVDGAGSMVVTGTASVSLVADVGMTNLLISGGTLSVNETEGQLTVGMLTQTDGNLSGTSDTVVTGSLAWSGGSMNGSGETIIEAGATALIDGPVDLRHQRKFTNKGAVVQSGSNSMRAYGDDAIVAVTNAAGGTWTEQSREGATMLYAYNGYGQASFVNAGKLVVASSCTIGGGGGKTVLTNDAELQIDAGQVFTLGSGTHGFAGGSSSKGSGQLKLSGATLNITGAATATDLLLENGTLRVQDAPLTVTAFSQTGGTLDGAEVLTVTGTFNWSGGSHNETGELVVGVEATALINGGVDLRHQRKFTNKGTVVQSGNNSMRAYGDDANVVVVTNADGATWTAESREGASILYSYNGYGKSSFVNAGTLVSQSSTSIGGGGGSTTLNNSGEIEVQAGTLGLFGVAATLQPGSKLKLTTAGGSVITGSADLTIAGTVEVFWTNGYTPGSAAVIPLINYASRSGTFASVTVPLGRSITNTSYGATHFEITLD